ncbi:MAG: macro domain-containing protein [Desulfovermiculus sp.]|nr:macro domain-containing protein [Desulfovermiculus sp.]
MSNLKEISGNIFESKCQVIVNTVNCYGVMGRGIALEFRYRYPDMYEEYKEICSRGLLKPGFLWIWKKKDPWIMCFPTKYHWKHPSKISYIEEGFNTTAKG